MDHSQVQQHPASLKFSSCGFAINFSVLLTICFIASGCSRSQQALVEAPPVYQPSPSPELRDVPKLPAKTDEVQVAVKRVFKDAAQLDTSRATNFLAGDFNGDNSQDIAVVVRPASQKLDEMNEDYRPWIVKDPFTPPLHVSRIRIEADDVLLAVIHGYGANDWRDPQATQTYLLKNAVGSGLEVQKKKEFLAANSDKKVPRLQGDVIGETLRGTSGFLYFTGPTYSWYDPRTFKGDPEIRLVHPGIVPKTRK